MQKKNKKKNNEICSGGINTNHQVIDVVYCERILQ